MKKKNKYANNIVLLSSPDAYISVHITSEQSGIIIVRIGTIYDLPIFTHAHCMCVLHSQVHALMCIQCYTICVERMMHAYGVCWHRPDSHAG